MASKLTNGHDDPFLHKLPNSPTLVPPFEEAQGQQEQEQQREQEEQLVVVVEEEEEQFEQVSLTDEEEQLDRVGVGVRVRAGVGSRGAGSFSCETSLGVASAAAEESGSSPASVSSRKSCSSEIEATQPPSLPVGSPLLHFGKAVLPHASPALMRLVDSSIRGAEEFSLRKLRSIVSGQERRTAVVAAVAVAGGGEYGEDPAKVVVDVLLSKMRGGASEEAAPRMMLSAGAAIIGGELLPWLPLPCRTRMANALVLVLKACTRNRAMCSASGLLGVLLDSTREILTTSAHDDNDEDNDDNSSSFLLEAIQLLASHSLTVSNLRSWLHIIGDLTPHRNATKLTLALEKTMCGQEARGPSHTFEFDGESSGLLGPGENRWPFSNGYAFATWLYIESFADALDSAAAAAAVATSAVAKTGTSYAMSVVSALAGEGTAHMPRLFSFLCTDNQGVEAYFHGQFLVVEISSTKGKKGASLHFTYSFRPHQWYFVGLEHSHRPSILGKAESEVKLYINGHLHESHPFDFPRVTKPLAFCCVGTNPPSTVAGLQRRRRHCPLFAEMGPVYIFKEPIGQDKMARLAARGGDTVPSFGFGAGAPCSLLNEQARELAEESFALDAEIAPSLHLLYHPKLLADRSCPDASPAGSAGMHRKAAEILGHVNVVSRTRPMEALWAVAEGGPMSLLPLAVGKVKKDSLGGDSNVPSSAAPILRIMSLALQHAGNAEELSRGHGPRMLALILEHLLCVGKDDHPGQVRPDFIDEEIIAAVVQLAQAPSNNQPLKTQLFRNLLLDLKLWSRCTYGLQKKLLSSLADMVFTESLTMKAAGAVQMLLDGCRQCYWIVPESDSIHLFAGGNLLRPIGELNALVDELLVIVELLVGSVAASEVGCLIQFVLDCPQPNQVARVLHLIYRLVVQPNVSRAAGFAEAFLASGGLEMLLTLLQHEGEAGETPLYAPYVGYDRATNPDEETEECHLTDGHRSSFKQADSSFQIENSNRAASADTASARLLVGRNLGGINLSIVADSARNNFQNMDSGDGIMLGIVSLLGALVTGGHLNLSDPDTLCNKPSGSTAVSSSPSSASNMSVWLLYALQKAFQGAPKRLMTDAIYSALLAAVVKSEAGSISSASDSLNLYDSVHCFEHIQLLSVILRTLPCAPRPLQIRALQDILLLTCTDALNREILTSMSEWPEWILEILICHSEVGSNKFLDRGAISTEIEDLVYNFLIIILEHSMRQKDGWMDVESTLHCAEWLAMVGGSSTGEQRQRREESLPIIKRKLLGSLLDFAARELQLQSQVVAAAAAAGVAAAGGLSPMAVKVDAEAVANTSTSLAENALVLLMLVEDHLRLQCQLFNPLTSSVSSAPASPRSFSSSPRHSSIGRTFSDGSENLSLRRFSSGSDSGGLSLDVLASMADSNGQISVAAMERLTAAAAAEPYESVRCAFASYGGCGVELSGGWKRRSQMWYGVGLPFKKANFGGGGGGWDAWNAVMEKDEHGDWVELPLIRKSVSVLESLLHDDTGYTTSGSNLGYGTVAGGMYSLQQLLDSDQPFFTMLRIILVAMREEDKGEGKDMNGSSKSQRLNNDLEKLSRIDSRVPFSVNMITSNDMKNKAVLLWRVLAPLLANVISESRRQRVLVTCCIIYTEVWHAVSSDRKILRKEYIESIVPPFAALLRRWRPLLCGVHELTDADGQSPLAVEDRSLATDAHPHEAALAMITPAWAAAFASPPAAMALAMAAAGGGGVDVTTSIKSTPLKREISIFEKKASRLRSFATFQKSVEPVIKVPKDKASAKAAASVAARDQERAAKIGSGRGLGAVAMASSGQRRNASDRERGKRWNLSESMHNAWCGGPSVLDSRNESAEREGSGVTVNLRSVLSMMIGTARKIQLAEVDRRASVAALDNTGKYLSNRAWHTLVRSLMEMEALFGPVALQFLSNQEICWKLDHMENSLRMRKRLRRNYKGSGRLGGATYFTEAKHQVKESEAIVENRQESDGAVPNSFLSQHTSTVLPDQIEYEESIEDDLSQSDTGDLEEQHNDAELHVSTSFRQPFTDFNNTIASVGSITGSKASQLDASISTGPTTQLMASEMIEQLLLETVAVMVQPLRISKGCFQVTTKHIFFIPDEDDGLNDPENHKIQLNMTVKQTKERAWLLSSLKEVHSRRHLLRRSALELFMLDRTNFFFDFGSSGGRRKVYKAILQSRPPFLSKIYSVLQRPEKILKRTKLTERWARWEISNFEYLMQLNTLSGRSYNDITQYPVFPWVLCDYSSESLNLQDPNVYRDLSKPVGALNPARLEKFLERYENFDDPVIPRFHYGSHYSSAGTILYYLVRLEPFTSLSIQLQGGRLDHADRMFSDIGSTWNGVLEDMSDVKELVPELFYMPEVLTNENNIQLGRTQKGEKLDDVKLPAWASSPIDFIQKHRAALESEFVSANLHNWIDLIFGYKQKGEESINACNVFYYMTYEGAVDIDQINDPVLRKATQDQIAYFGQTPSQLLTTGHVKRKSLSEVIHLQTIFRNPPSIQCYEVSSPERCNVPAGAISALNDALVVVDMCAPSCRVAVHKWQAHTPDEQGFPFHFEHGKPANNSSSGALIRMFSRQQSSVVTEWQYPRALAFAAPGIKSDAVVVITGDAYLLTGGHADNNVKLISPKDARTLETAIGHSAPVTCLSLSPDGNTLVTGSRDSTAILWRIRSHNNSSGLSDLHTAGSDTAQNIVVKRIEGPVNVLRGHVDELTSCCINTDLDLVVTCSLMKGVLFHSISKGRLIRRLPLLRADIVGLSSEGILVIWDKIGRSLRTFTINGALIAQIEFPASEGDIVSITVSTDGCHAVLGTCVPSDHTYRSMSVPMDEKHITDNGRTAVEPIPAIVLYNLHTLQMLHTYKLRKGQDVTCVALNGDNTTLLVSTVDGELLVYTDPTLNIKLVDEMFRHGWEGEV